MSKFLKISKFNAGARLVKDDGAPTAEFLRQMNDMISNISSAVNSVKDQTDMIQFSLEQAGIALTTAQEAKDLAEAEGRKQALTQSYTEPANVLSAAIDPADATKAIITIAAHTRIYVNGTSVSVSAGTINGQPLDTSLIVYYVDVERAGGLVTYQVTQDQTVGAQVNDTHCVGVVQTPASGATEPTSGNGGGAPGVPRKFYEGGRVSEV